MKEKKKEKNIITKKFHRTNLDYLQKYKLVGPKFKWTRRKKSTKIGNKDESVRIYDII